MLKSITEALESKEPITDLIITKEDLLRGLPPEISSFTNLKKLEITGSSDGTLPFPKQLLKLPIEDLKLQHFRVFEVFELKTLKKLTLWSHFTQDDIGPICRSLKQLTYLEINGCNAIRPLIIPTQIIKLTELEELRISCCAMTALADELAQLQKLKTLAINHQAFTEFPLVLAKIPHLEILEFTHCQLVTKLPNEIQNLTALKSLNLSNNFRGKVNLSFEEEMDDLFDDIDNEKTNVGFILPEAFGKLSNLEHLILTEACLSNIETLKHLKNLKTLDLSCNKKITDVTPISQLTDLEALDLTQNYYIKDISSLLTLTHLKTLVLESTFIENISAIEGMFSLTELNIECCNRISSLESILKHSTLKTLKANEEIMSLWDKRADFLAMDNKEKIKELLVSNVLEDVKHGITQFAKYVELTSVSEENATYTFFGLNKNKFRETELIKLEELETVLKKFEQELDTEYLIKIIRSTLSYNIYDNFEVTLLAIDILIKRKDVKGQNAVIECFIKACQHYDPGHRYYENTVQDALLEIIFPEFEGEPLANLLLWCDSDYLLSDMGLDGMDALFEPAFEKLKDVELEEKLLNHFTAYINDRDNNYINYSKILEGYEKASPKVQVGIKLIKENKY